MMAVHDQSVYLYKLALQSNTKKYEAAQHHKFPGFYLEYLIRLVHKVNISGKPSVPVDIVIRQYPQIP